MINIQFSRITSIRIHLKFDEHLQEKGVNYGYTYTNTVYDRMDRDVSYWGADHRDIDWHHDEEGIRDWLRTFQHLAYRKRLQITYVYVLDTCVLMRYHLEESIAMRVI